jgi:hypothetical protein
MAISPHGSTAVIVADDLGETLCDEWLTVEARRAASLSPPRFVSDRKQSEEMEKLLQG